MTSEEIYLSRLKGFQGYYLQLVIFSAAAICVGITVAVISNVLFGTALVLVSAYVYVWFSTREAHKQLGIGFSNVEGRIVIKKLEASYGDCAVVPTRFIWADVTSLADGALSSDKNSELERIYVPKSIERIGRDIFGKDGISIKVCYEGTAEEWNAIESLTDFSSCEISFESQQPTLPQRQKKSRAPKSSDGEARS